MSSHSIISVTSLKSSVESNECDVVNLEGVAYLSAREAVRG
jgi:hypothetical protein